MGNMSRAGLSGVPPRFLEPEMSATALVRFPLVSESFTPPFTGSISATGSDLSKERRQGESLVVSRANTDLATGDIHLELHIEDGGTDSMLQLDTLRSPTGFPYGDFLTNATGIQATIALPPFAGADAIVEVAAEIELLGIATKLETDAINVLATVVWDMSADGVQVTPNPNRNLLYSLRTGGSSLDLPVKRNQTLTFAGTLPPGPTSLIFQMGARLDFERIYNPRSPARSSIHLLGGGPPPWPHPLAPTPILRLSNFSVNVFRKTP
jgi:hypothetical protein